MQYIGGTEALEFAAEHDTHHAVFEQPARELEDEQLDGEQQHEARAQKGVNVTWISDTDFMSDASFTILGRVILHITATIDP